jgi:flagellar protein FlaI
MVELVGFEPETNELITNTVYEWDSGTDTFIYKGHSFILDELMEMKNMTHEEMDVEFQRRVDLISYLVEKDITDFEAISELVVSYYQFPDETIKKLRDEMGWVREEIISPTKSEEGETFG